MAEGRVAAEPEPARAGWAKVEELEAWPVVVPAWAALAKVQVAKARLIPPEMQLNALAADYLGCL